MAARLGKAGISAALGEAQFSAGAEIVLGRLTAGGLPQAAAEATLGPALTPAALDPLAILGEP